MTPVNESLRLHQPSNGDEPIPVSILTGFLGSGKTTLVNEILGCDHGLRVGVIVNDFGDVSIDDKLISNRAESVIELANGCICCSMQGDLLRTLQQVTASKNAIDYILLETSGLSDPLPVAHAILDKSLGASVRLDGIITMIDALNFDANLSYAEVAFNQLVHGDLILINKVDLVDKSIPGRIEEGVRKLNCKARILSCVRGKVALQLLLDVSISELQSIHDKMPDADRPRATDTTAFDCVAFESDAPIDASQFQSFVQSIPHDVYRGKGILHVADDSHERVFHLVGDRCVVTQGQPWSSSADRRTQLVFIGRHLEKSDLLNQLNECLASN